VLATAAAVVAAGLVLRWAWPAATPPAAGGHLVLAVADVDNQTGEKELELSGLLRTVLEQSTFLDVLPRGRLIDALPESRSERPVRLDETAARAAARAVRARFVLLARLLRLGETYLIEVRAIDPASGASRFSFREQDRGKESLPALLDRAGERARLLFGESPAAIQQRTIPAGQVTSSLEAWRRYSSGMACFERGYLAGSFAACLDDLEKAVLIDPGFALAHLQISVLRWLEGKPRALQQQALQQAQAHADRVPPHDRRRLDGWVALMDDREQEAKALLRSAAESSPDDKVSWWLAGEVPYHRDEFAEALPIFRKLHALNPTWATATQHLVFVMGVTGDLEGLRVLVRELDALRGVPGAISAASYARLWVDPAGALATCDQAATPLGEEADECVAVALLNVKRRGELRGHLDAMEQRERQRGERTGFAWYMKLILLGQEGRWTDVERTARAGDQEDAWFHGQLAELIAGAGDPAPVGREALRVIEVDRARASSLAVHLAYLGDLLRASELARYLPPGSPREEAYRAVVRWRSGDLQGAITSLRRLADAAPVSAAPRIPPPLYLLGEALAEAGQDAEAVQVLRRYQAIPMTQPTWFWPRSQWFLARSLDRLGDREGARAVLAPLLQLWAQASAGQPHLAEARALGGRLGIR
jgi:tetratricopeptide (TPR) repeat protein